MRFCWGVEACDEITVQAAVFTILVSIAFKLLSTMGTDKGVIGFLLNLLPVAVPPCHAAGITAETLVLSFCYKDGVDDIDYAKRPTELPCSS